MDRSWRSSVFLLLTISIFGCGSEPKAEFGPDPSRRYQLERVGPANVVQLYAEEFEQLTARERVFIYYLSLAALAGRDIAIDQRHRHALEVRDLFEAVYQHAAGIDPQLLSEITAYLKLFWINNGSYDHLTSRKFVPQCSFEEFRKACERAAANGGELPEDTETLTERLERLKLAIFDETYEPILTNKTPGTDWIAGSAVNYYHPDLTGVEVEAWAGKGREIYPLNSMVVKEKGRIAEKVWRAGDNDHPAGLYSRDLKAVVRYLEQAIPFAASDYQKDTIRKLIKYLKTGNPQDFHHFNVHWVRDDSNVDFILGFIEVYLDPRGQKGEWEAVVFYADPELTRLMKDLASLAQYFEDKAPWEDVYKKKIDQSPIAKIIHVAMETGGTGPISPIGINLPNEQAIRQEFGSKSILLQNIVDAYGKSQGKELIQEFAWDAEEVALNEEFGSRANRLRVAMHEVIGHGSGKVSLKLEGKDPADLLPGYYSTLEEARADLVALWNAWDDKLIDMDLAKDRAEARLLGETIYQKQIRGALSQLRRIGTSQQLEQDHMKNRALIAHYLIDRSRGVKVEQREGKTYYRVVDYDLARKGVGELLSEVMRIKAEGDLAAAKSLVDQYGLKVDIELRDEVQRRVKKLNVASYTGFVMPKLKPVKNAAGEITDVEVSYPLDLAQQMLEYSAFTRQERKK